MKLDLSDKTLQGHVNWCKTQRKLLPADANLLVICKEILKLRRQVKRLTKQRDEAKRLEVSVLPTQGSHSKLADSSRLPHHRVKHRVLPEEPGEGAAQDPEQTVTPPHGPWVCGSHGR